MFHLLQGTDHECLIKGENAKRQKKYSEYTSVLKFALSNVQKECFIMHYQNH